MLIFTSIVYIMIGLIGLYYFGNTLHSNILNDFGRKNLWDLKTLQIFYAIILVLNIINMFHLTKESFLVLLDEYMRSSISRVLTPKRKQTHEIKRETSMMTNESGDGDDSEKG